jgi:Na+-transporting methylmalonyl-CoA/oxaloacetate decarboxylase gamma subunit
MPQYQSINEGINFVLIGVFVLGGLSLLIFIFYLYKKFVKKNLALRANDLVLLEVRLPKKFEKEEYEQLKSVKDITAVADQFFTSIAGMYKEGFSGIFSGQPVVSFEYVAKDKEIIFYVGVPQSMRSMLEKQIQSFYPNANIEPSGDFRVFRNDLHISYGMVKNSRSFIYPIRTYTELDSDSVANITNVLSKIGEGSRAVIQIVVRPTNQSWRANTEIAIRRIQEGKGVFMGMGISNKIFFFFNNLFSIAAQKDQNTQKLTPLQEETIKHLTAKSSKPGFDVQIRLVSLATTKSEADANLNNIFSSFSQFSTPDRNGFKMTRKYEKKAFLTHFILRTFIGYKKSLLNSEELASIFHFPSEHIDTPGIRWFNAKRAPAPANLPKEGIILGKNTYRGEEVLVRLKDADRRRHLYSIGMTGTGKSTFFESMILQDIKSGKGVAVFDPHGELVESILGKIPKERAEDVIYFDPSDTSRPMGVNLLEWKTKEQKDFLVQESIQIFYKLFDPNGQGMIGPQFEHWMRNAALTLMDYPTGGTLIEIPKLFTDDEFRKLRIDSINDPVVKAFWQQQMTKTSDFHKSEMYNYFISKFGRFMTNITMRNIIGQTKSSFDFRSVMDSGKILLINLSKGQIGEINSNLLGMIFVAKLFTAALSRGEVPEDQRKDFYLYVDEFQNFATDTFASILSEARKFRLNLSITNQYIAQIPEPIRDAIIGNVGTLISFRIGVPDAEFMAKEFEPVANQNDLNQIDAYNAYVKILINNAPTKPFSMQTIKDPTEDNINLAKAIKDLSRLKFGRDVSIVENEIADRVKISATEQKQDLTREAGGA